MGFLWVEREIEVVSIFIYSVQKNKVVLNKIEFLEDLIVVFKGYMIRRREFICFVEEWFFGILLK